MALLIRNLTKTLQGHDVLLDINIRAQSASVTGLAGVNGSGKTMLMRVVAGLVRPTSGEVSIDGSILGKDIAFPPSVGLLIENPAFLPGRTGRSNLEILASIRGVTDGQCLRDTLSFVGLDPDDNRHFSKYSLGMKQRLGLAAAVMECPDLLLLDEPTNALDSSGVHMLERLVEKSRDRGATIILACHDANILRELSDQIYYLAEGHIDGHEILREQR